LAAGVTPRPVAGAHDGFVSFNFRRAGRDTTTTTTALAHAEGGPINVGFVVAVVHRNILCSDGEHRAAGQKGGRSCIIPRVFFSFRLEGEPHWVR